MDINNQYFNEHEEELLQKYERKWIFISEGELKAVKNTLKELGEIIDPEIEGIAWKMCVGDEIETIEIPML